MWKMSELSVINSFAWTKNLADGGEMQRDRLAIAVRHFQPTAGNLEDSLSLGTGGDGGVFGISG